MQNNIFKKTRLFLAFILAVSCKEQQNLPLGLYAKLETTKGPITVALAYDKVPLACINFAGLAEGLLGPVPGKPFYDGLSFHRVEPDFVVQGGDPLGNGTGDPGYNFPDEFDPELKHDGPGVLAMANQGPDTNGCQFYISLRAIPELDMHYTVFGHVVEGMSVVESLELGDVIKKVSILRIGDSAKAFKTDQEAFAKYYTEAKEASVIRQKKQREAEEARLLQNWPGLIAGENGILYKVLKEGPGQKPEYGSQVKAEYKAMLPDGTVFDQSALHGKPLEFTLGAGSVIPGWEAGIAEMRKGEKRLVAIPPSLAYGQSGISGVIPPNSYILLEIHLIE